jgi:S-(hydroxymethyl)glutathione dehydrogenase/alcohol dehydrogenase
MTAHPVRAAVAKGAGAPLSMEVIELWPPKKGQVRVRLAAAGVCHSDLSLLNGTLPHPTPAVLGHEGAGTVLEIGPEVERLQPGDRVVLSWRPACGSCPLCSAGQPYLCPQADLASRSPIGRTADGDEVFPGLGVAAFAEETVVPEAGAIPLDEDIPLQTAALLGCAALTGFGAVRNCGGVRPGQSVLVLGAGGVGMVALQTARLSGAHPIIAVDVSAGKEARARACGATDFLVSGPRIPDEVRELTGSAGVDYAIECVGSSATIVNAWRSTRRGGTTIVVGAGSRCEQIGFSAFDLFYSARTLVGCLHGNADPARTLPELVRHLRSGDIDLGVIITDMIGHADIPRALRQLAAGEGGRSLVVY